MQVLLHDPLVGVLDLEEDVAQVLEVDLHALQLVLHLARLAYLLDDLVAQLLVRPQVRDQVVALVDRPAQPDQEHLQVLRVVLLAGLAVRALELARLAEQVQVLAVPLAVLVEADLRQHVVLERALAELEPSVRELLNQRSFSR